MSISHFVLFFSHSSSLCIWRYHFAPALFPVQFSIFISLLKNFHHILMPCQLSSPSCHVSGKVRVTTAQCSASPHPSLRPSLKAWSGISSSHYAQTWHLSNSRSYKQPHISPIPRVYVCVWVESLETIIIHIAQVYSFKCYCFHWPVLRRVESKWKTYCTESWMEWWRERGEEEKGLEREKKSAGVPVLYRGFDTTASSYLL